MRISSTAGRKWGIYITGTSDILGPGYVNVAEFGVPDFYSLDRIDDGQWHHVALVRSDDGRLKLLLMEFLIVARMINLWEIFQRISTLVSPQK